MSEPEILTPEQVARLRERLSKNGRIEPQNAIALCVTVDAMAEVIERYQNGWREGRAPSVLGWWVAVHCQCAPEPMHEAHQVAVYGQVYRHDEEDPR